MKKKELRNMTKLSVTQKMRNLVAEDKPKKTLFKRWYSSFTRMVCKRYQYYRAVVENDILKLAIFSGKQIAAGQTDPEYEIYISRKENAYLTFETATGRWRTARIDRLKYDIYDGWIAGNKPWYEETTKKLVNEYLGSGKLEIKDAVLKYQNEVLGEKLNQRHRSEIEEIDAVMNAVPELPKDFDDWIIKSAFIKERYIFYYAGTRKGYCTHCGEMVELKQKPAHNQPGKCPHCHSHIVLKAYKKQQCIRDEKEVGIIQKLTDDTGYVYRKFCVKIERRLENNWKTSFAGCWENERIVTDRQMYTKRRYEWGEYKCTGVVRWCAERTSYYEYEPDCVLYYRNIKKLRKEWGLKYMPMEEVLRSNPGWYIRPLRMIRTLKNEPKLEYLIKAGMTKLVWDICSNRDGKLELMKNAKKPWEFLGVTKEQMQQCIRLNVSARELLTMKNASRYEVSLTDEQVRYFAKKIGPELMEKIAVFGHAEKFMKYFTKELSGDREIGDYFDYLKDLKALRIPITKSILFPKNFQTIHLETALQREEKENEIRKMEIAQKDELLRQMLPELEEIYQGENEKFLLVLPTCKEDFNREGRENHNCVGGSYYDKMLKGECVVMFLRKKEEPEKAFCTVEMDGSKIRQCRATRNSAAPEDAMAFMRKYEKQVKKRLEEKNKELLQAAG